MGEMAFQTLTLKVFSLVFLTFLLLVPESRAESDPAQAIRSYLAIREREGQLAAGTPGIAHRLATRWLREADLPRTSPLVAFLPPPEQLREEAYDLLHELTEAGYLSAGRTLFFHLYSRDPGRAKTFLYRLCELDKGNIYGFCLLSKSLESSSLPPLPKLSSSPQALLTMGRAFETGVLPRSFEKARKFFLASYQAGLEEGASALARLHEKEARRSSFVCTLPESRNYEEFVGLKRKKRNFYLKEAIKWYQATTRTYEKIYRVIRLEALLRETQLLEAEKIFFASQGVTLAWRDLVPPGERGPSVKPRRISLTREALACLKNARCSEEEALRLLRKACLQGERTAEVVLADFLPDPKFKFLVYRYHAERGSEAAFQRIVRWLIESKHFQEAEQWLRFGRKSGFQEDLLLFLHAELSLAQGKEAKALSLLKTLADRGDCAALLKLLKLSPEEGLSSAGMKVCSLPPEVLGQAYYRSGNLQKALTYYLESTKQNQDPEVLRRIGSIYLELGNETPAKIWLLKAFQSGAKLNRKETRFLAKDLARRGVKNGTVYLALAQEKSGFKALCCAFLAAKEREPKALFYLLKLIWRDGMKHPLDISQLEKCKCF